MALQIRRGTDAERQLVTPLIGELMFTTDTKLLYVGDGSTPGGISVDLGATLRVEAIDDLTDVAITTPVVGQVLKYDGANWINDTDLNTGTGSLAIDDLTDVAITTPSAGQVLKYDGANWINDTDLNTGTGSLAIDDLTDVAITTPVVDQVLKYDGANWINDAAFVEADRDYNISIRGADSSIIVDSSTGSIFGTVTGNLNSSAIVLTNSSTFQTPISISYYDNDSQSAIINYRKFRGTVISPAAVLPGDEIFRIVGQGYDGTNNVSVASIIGFADSTGTIGSGSIPGNLEFNTADTTGILRKRLEINKDGRITVYGEMYTDLVYISSRPEKPYSMAITHNSNSTDGSFVLVQRSRGTELAPLAVTANDQIGSTSYRGFTGTQFVSSAVISAIADPSGVITNSAVPGQLIFSTAGDDGSLRNRLTIDKNGTIIGYGQHWIQTSTPTGLPKLLLANTSTVSAGARSAMRRSRGSFITPTSVLDADVLFRLMWGGHDGTSYRDTASIEGVVSGTVSTGVIPTKLDIKTTDTNGTLITAATVTAEQTVEAFGAIKFATYATPTARDTKFTTGVVQAGMVVFLTDSTGSGGAPKLQVNTDGTTSGWVDLH
jgi:hypothetical protein